MSEIGKRPRGRPKKSDLVQNSENQNINQNNFDEDSDLKEYLKEKKEMSDNLIVDNIDEAVLKEIENISDAEVIEDDNNYNPLEDAVQDRGYTKGIIQNTNPVSERVIEEPTYQSVNAVKPDVDEKLLNSNTQNQNQSNNNQSNNTQSNNNQPQNQFGDVNNNSQTTSNQSSSSNNEEKPSTEKKLTAKEQREGAEKTADIALLAYKNYIPLPFIYFGSINVKKLKDSEKKGEIDLQAPIDRKGTRFIDRVEKFNKEVEASFEVTDEEVEAIREPLIDVLMEKEVSLTPTQRLIFVAGQFVVAKVINVVRLVSEQRSMISEMKEMHKEKMESERLNREVVKSKVVKQKPKQEADVDDEDEDKSFIKNNKEDYSNTARKAASEDINKAETVNYTEVPTLDDVINSKSDDDDLNEIEEDKITDDDDDNDIPD